VSITYSSVIRKLEVPSWTSPQVDFCLPCPLTSDHPSSRLVVFALSYNENATVANCKRRSLHQSGPLASTGESRTRAFIVRKVSDRET